MINDHYLDRCCSLALLGGKATKSNPMVGAVLVYQDTIIGEGYHEYFGGPHAEVNCLQSVKDKDRHLIPKSTLYVSLEPCCIERKTPACTNLILEHQIQHVVVGALDPNPEVHGKGITILRSHGVHVEVIEDTTCQNLLSKFKANLHKRPYIIIKWAQSFDGYMGHVDKQIWLSNEFSKVYVHKLRSECDGILIGKNTALTDNPRLTVRYYDGDQPIRMVMDANLTLPTTLHLWQDEYPTFILNELKNEEIGNIKYIKVNPITDIKEVLHTLFQHGIYSVLVEGGKKILDWFIENQMWDEAHIIQTPVKLKNEFPSTLLLPSPSIQGKLVQKTELEGDVIIKLT